MRRKKFHEICIFLHSKIKFAWNIMHINIFLVYFFSVKKYEKENEKKLIHYENSVGEKPEIILLVAIYICAQNFLSWLQNVNGHFSPSADKHIYNFGVIFKLILKKKL